MPPNGGPRRRWSEPCAVRAHHVASIRIEFFAVRWTGDRAKSKIGGHSNGLERVAIDRAWKCERRVEIENRSIRHEDHMIVPKYGAPRMARGALFPQRRASSHIRNHHDESFDFRSEMPDVFLA